MYPFISTDIRNPHHTDAKHSRKHDSYRSIIFGTYIMLYPGDSQGCQQARNYRTSKESQEQDRNEELEQTMEDVVEELLSKEEEIFEF